jgi:hypothetical protein
MKKDFVVNTEHFILNDPDTITTTNYSVEILDDESRFNSAVQLSFEQILNSGNNSVKFNYKCPKGTVDDSNKCDVEKTSKEVRPFQMVPSRKVLASGRKYLLDIKANNPQMFKDLDSYQHLKYLEWVQLFESKGKSAFETAWDNRDKDKYNNGIVYGMFLPDDVMKSNVERINQNLHKMFDGAPKLPEPIKVYRGVVPSSKVDLKVGDVFEEPMFVSTSRDPSIALDYALTYRNNEHYDKAYVDPSISVLEPSSKYGIETTLMEMHIPEGSRALSLESVMDDFKGKPKTMDPNKRQKEVFLDSHQKFEVTSIERVDDVTNGKYTFPIGAKVITVKLLEDVPKLNIAVQKAFEQMLNSGNNVIKFNYKCAKGTFDDSNACSGRYNQPKLEGNNWVNHPREHGKFKYLIPEIIKDEHYEGYGNISVEEKKMQDISNNVLKNGSYRAAVDRYEESSDVNGYLTHPSDKMPDAVKEDIKTLDAMFNDDSLGDHDDIILFRGVKPELIEGMQEDGADLLKHGTVFQNKAFTSATASTELSDWFSGASKGNVIMEIKVPRGVPVLYTGERFQDLHPGTSQYIIDQIDNPNFRECLLPRDLTFKIASVRGEIQNLNIDVPRGVGSSVAQVKRYRVVAEIVNNVPHQKLNYKCKSGTVDDSNKCDVEKTSKAELAKKAAIEKVPQHMRYAPDQSVVNDFVSKNFVKSYITTQDVPKAFTGTLPVVKMGPDGNWIPLQYNNLEFKNGIIVTVPPGFEDVANEIAYKKSMLPGKLGSTKVNFALSPNKHIAMGSHGAYATANAKTSAIVIYSDAVTGKIPSHVPTDFIVHETAHILDKNNKFSFSSEYRQAVALDGGHEVSDYAADASAKIRKGTRTKYTEDFAEAVRDMIRDPVKFENEYPNRSNIIKKAVFESNRRVNDKKLNGAVQKAFEQMLNSGNNSMKFNYKCPKGTVDDSNKCGDNDTKLTKQNDFIELSNAGKLVKQGKMTPEAFKDYAKKLYEGHSTPLLKAHANEVYTWATGLGKLWDEEINVLPLEQSELDVDKINYFRNKLFQEEPVFQEKTESDVAFEEAYKPKWKEFSKNQQGVLTEYQSPTAYDIKDYLNDTPEAQKYWSKLYINGVGSFSYDDIIKNIDSTLSETPEDVTTYRNFDPNKFENLNVGDEIKSNTYTSVGMNKDVALLYNASYTKRVPLEKRQYGVLNVKVPKGTRAVYIPAGISLMHSELVLDRGLSMKVDSIRKEKDITYIDASIKS